MLVLQINVINRKCNKNKWESITIKKDFLVLEMTCFCKYHAQGI